MEKDPAKDREEFEKRLKSLFIWCDGEFCIKAFKAILNDNTSEISRLKSYIESNEQKISDYLSKWDAAKTYEERRKIVGSVKL